MGFERPIWCLWREKITLKVDNSTKVPVSRKNGETGVQSEKVQNPVKKSRKEPDLQGPGEKYSKFLPTKTPGKGQKGGPKKSVR